jgi:hypothetical protein
MTTLDDEISSAFALLGLLLVFVIGYFAALFPLAQDLLEQPAPEVKADRRALISRLRTYRVLVEGVLLLTVATGVVVTPLTRRVMLVTSFRGPFPTIEAGLLPHRRHAARALRGDGVGVGPAWMSHPDPPRSLSGSCSLLLVILVDLAERFELDPRVHGRPGWTAGDGCGVGDRGPADLADLARAVNGHLVESLSESDR